MMQGLVGEYRAKRIIIHYEAMPGNNTLWSKTDAKSNCGAGS